MINNKTMAMLSVFCVSQLAACSSSNKTTELVSTLEWDECTTAAIEYECSSFKVPMDYSNPEGRELDIALIRLPASGDEKLGTLTFMYGGPSPYVEFTPLILRFGTIPGSIRESYDIVGFDQRGIGDSTTVDCSEFQAGVEHPYPTNTNHIAQLHADYTRMADACVAKEGELLQHLGSLNVVRDMDRMRIALGEEKLNMVSSSFGTLFSALYMQEFPQSSGRVVHDASLPPDVIQRNLFIDSLVSREANLLNALSICETTDPECNPSELLAKLTQLANDLAEENTEDSRFELLVLDRFVFGRLLEDPGYAEYYMPSFVEYINTGDSAAIEVAIVEAEDEELFDDLEFDAIDRALKCADDGFRPQVADLEAQLLTFNQESDFFAESTLAFASSCAGWPESLTPLSPIATGTAPVSLVIGGTNDNLTTIGWSEEMASQIGGVLIRSNHDGHGAAYLDKSECVDSLITAFLLDGMVPATQECI